MTKKSFNYSIFAGWAHRFELYDSFEQELSSHFKNYDTKIVIAHSIGMHYIKLEELQDAHLLVLVSCFEKFCDSRFVDIKLQKRIVDKMLARLLKDPRVVLKDFYKNCGIANEKIGILVDSFDNDDLDRLYEELVFLKNNEFNIGLIDSQKIPILLMHSKNDRIIDFKLSQGLYEAISRNNPMVKMIQFDGLSHSLLTTDYNYCYQEIVSYYNSIYE